MPILKPLSRYQGEELGLAIKAAGMEGSLVSLVSYEPGSKNCLP